MYNRLRGLREDRDLTQREMAQVLIVHQTTYSDYELGKVNIPNESLVQLAQFFDTSVDYILCQTDDPSRYPKSKHGYQ